MTDRCRSCDAEVVFVPSEKSGKAMILDAKPAKGVVLTNPTGIPRGDLVHYVTSLDDSPEASVVDVYTDHHATCPNAADWKGKNR